MAGFSNDAIQGFLDGGQRLRQGDTEVGFEHRHDVARFLQHFFLGPAIEIADGILVVVEAQSAIGQRPRPTVSRKLWAPSPGTWGEASSTC